MNGSSVRFDGPAEIFPGHVLVPTGGKVIYVHNLGAAALDALPPGMAGNADAFCTTLNQAFATCRANRGDTICELPGHAESHATATELSNIKAGVKVIGMSNGISDMPLHTFTAAAAQWAISAAGVVFQNIRLNLGGFNGVTKALNVTGPQVIFNACRIQMSASGVLKAVIGMEIGSGATEFQLRNSYLYGASGVAVTDGIKFVGATVPSNFVIDNNDFIYAATEVNGLVHVTVAALDGVVKNNRFVNTVAASTAGFVVDNVASTGFMVGNDFADLNNGTATAQGAIFGAGSLWRVSRGFESNEANRGAIASPTATT